MPIVVSTETNAQANSPGRIHVSTLSLARSLRIDSRSGQRSTVLVRVSAVSSRTKLYSQKRVRIISLRPKADPQLRAFAPGQ